MPARLLGLAEEFDRQAGDRLTPFVDDVDSDVSDLQVEMQDRLRAALDEDTTLPQSIRQ